VINEEKESALKHLLMAFQWTIDKYIMGILDDSVDDPHLSAVMLRNYIVWYIESHKELGLKPPFVDCEDCFKKLAYSRQAYKDFERRRSDESKIYRGQQW
jgi:hypothetical protein